MQIQWLYNKVQTTGIIQEQESQKLCQKKIQKIKKQKQKNKQNKNLPKFWNQILFKLDEVTADRCSKMCRAHKFRAVIDHKGFLSKY